MTDTHSIPLIIRALGRGKKGTRNLTADEAEFLMSAILKGNITGPQLGAFLMLMRVKEETAEELSGMIIACEKFINHKPLSCIDVNWPAYAGKKKQSSWYILAAKLLAENGIKILIHGGGEHTEGRQYARAVCETIGLKIASTLTSAEQIISKDNIAYIAMNDINPTLSHLIDMKAELGLRSPVNTLVRHINPLKAALTLQGMFHPAYMPLHHETSVLLKQNNNLVLKGDGGEFEVRPDSETKVSINSDFCCLEDNVPAALKARSIRPDSVSFEPLQQLWDGELANEYGEQAVIQTAALILAQLKKQPLKEAVLQVELWWQKRN
jgi:anthranilate phosphoribosyltransferase